MRAAIVIVLAAAAALAGFYYRLHGNPAVPGQADAHPLFSQTLPDASGASQPLSRWRGRLLVVNFWATWCPPCVAEMPDLEALQQSLATSNLQVIGIGIDSPSNIRDFAQKHHITYPLYVAGMEGTRLVREMGDENGGLPFTVVVDPEGRVIKTHLGKLNVPALRKDLDPLLRR
ncbi:MAG: TlpA family protein disulfide reductase [Burkholderiaceae bacterium]